MVSMKNTSFQLATLHDAAIEAIRKLLIDPDTPPSARLRAAKLVFDAMPDPPEGPRDRAIHTSEPAPAPQQRPVRPIAVPNSHICPEPKIGRNDYCPCGSGLKFKKCCLNKSIPAVIPKAPCVAAA